MTTTPAGDAAVWSDDDPLMQAIAADVWEQCSSEYGPALTVDDPRNIAAVAATVARRVLGETTTDTGAQPADRRERYKAAIRETDGWVLDDGQHMIDAVMAVADSEIAAARAVLPTPADRAAAPLTEVWTVWREDEPAYGHFATEDAAKQGTIDYWQEDEPSCPDYSWRQDGPRLELVVGGEHGGVYASRHRVYGAPAPADRESRLADEAQQPEDVEPTEEQIVREHVTTVHLIGEQLAAVESWLWERLADARAAKQQPTPATTEEPTL